mmetsp:Transcript_15249/g.59636  ORF Transcript_15249/g.59636 Transcript_15249/m.59636 type:complete len:286 (+) Transcript_15249:87-944(+)
MDEGAHGGAGLLQGLCDGSAGRGHDVVLLEEGVVCLVLAGYEILLGEDLGAGGDHVDGEVLGELLQRSRVGSLAVQRDHCSLLAHAMEVDAHCAARGGAHREGALEGDRFLGGEDHLREGLLYGAAAVADSALEHVSSRQLAGGALRGHGGARLQRSLGCGRGEAAKVLHLRHKVRLRLELTEHCGGAALRHAEAALAGGAAEPAHRYARLRGQRLHGGLHVHVIALQRLLAVHDACTGPLAHLAHQLHGAARRPLLQHGTRHAPAHAPHAAQHLQPNKCRHLSP